VEMFVPAMVTRRFVDVDDAVVGSIVEGLRPTPLTRPVIIAPLARRPVRVGPAGLRDEDDSPQAAQAITPARIAGAKITGTSGSRS
jgi:hypothetical protein